MRGLPLAPAGWGGPHLAHGDSSLDSGCHGVHAGAHAQEVDGLVLLADGVLRVDPRHLHVPLLDGLGNEGETKGKDFTLPCSCV